MTDQDQPHERLLEEVQTLRDRLARLERMEERWVRAVLLLQESEARFRNVLENSRDGIYQLNLRTEAYDYLSPAVARILGYPLEEMLTRDLSWVIAHTHPDDVARLEEHIRQLKTHTLEGTINPVIEYRFQTGHLGYRWISDSRAVVFDTGPDPVAIVGNIRDVTDGKRIEEELREANDVLEIRVQKRTAELAQANQALQAEIAERRRAEEALRTSEERFRALIEHSSDALSLNSADGTVLYISPPATRIFGYAREEMLRSRPFEKVHPEDCANAQRVLAEVLNNPGKVITGAYRVRHKDGSWRWIETTVTNLLAEPSIGALVGNHRDITQRKQAEEQVHESLRRELLLKKELHHRVKNNLQVVSSLLYLQSTLVDDPATRTILQESQSRVRSIALIHEKLYQAEDLARIDLAEYVHSLARDLFEIYRVAPDRVALEVNVQGISLDIDAAVPCGLILNELISNALKYAFPGGQGTLSVELWPAGDDRIMLTVRDNGVGLPDTLDIAQPRSLGLRLVHDLARQLDATLEVDTASGTVFRLSLADPQNRERG